MILSYQNLISFITILFSGLIAGLLFSYSCSVNPGLSRLSDKEYLEAMQSINNVIQNPFFFLPFMGLLIMLPLNTLKNYSTQPGLSFYFLCTSTALYIIGVFGVTVLGNIPLNNQLARFPIAGATVNEISSMRISFETSWNNYHLLRTMAAIMAFGFSILSIFKFNQ